MGFLDSLDLYTDGQTYNPQNWYPNHPNTQADRLYKSSVNIHIIDILSMYINNKKVKTKTDYFKKLWIFYSTRLKETFVIYNIWIISLYKIDLNVLMCTSTIHIYMVSWHTDCLRD